MAWTCWRTFASAIVTLSLVSGGCGSKKDTEGKGGAGGASGASGGAPGGAGGGGGVAAGSGSAGVGGAGGASGGAGPGGAAGLTGGAASGGRGGGAVGVTGSAGGGGQGGAAGGSAGAAGDRGGAGGAGTAGAMGTAGASGGVAWSGTRILGTGTSDYVSGMAVDASGNIFINGTTGAALYGQTAGASYDMFALKLNAAGALQWAAQIAGDGYESGGDVALDGAGNVYIAGSTYPSIDGDAGAGGFDAVLAKFDSTGARQWIRHFGSAGYDYGVGVRTDAAGNVYVAGYAGDALPGNTSAGQDDAFLIKFDSAGTQQWARQFGTAANEFVTSATIDAAGNVYVAGYTTDPSGMLPNAPEVGHVFLAKYDGAGTAQWTRAIVSNGSETPTGVAADRAGNVYVVGITSGDLGGSGNAGLGDAYVIKYDGAGNRIWARQLGTDKRDGADSVTTDAAGNVYVGGGTYGGFETAPSGGVSVAYVAKYDSAGARAWLRQAPMNANYASALAIDPRGDVVVAGQCNGAFDGQPALGLADIFVMKLSADGVKY